jgi:hypothetical protein
MKGSSFVHSRRAMTSRHDEPRRRTDKPVIPLTDASIEYVSAGQPQRVALGTVVVNRELTDWFRLAVVEDADPPEVPAGEVGPLTKDFTDQVLRAWND